MIIFVYTIFGRLVFHRSAYNVNFLHSHRYVIFTKAQSFDMFFVSIFNVVTLGVKILVIAHAEYYLSTLIIRNLILFKLSYCFILERHF